jgi:hypothetical protein
VSADIYIGGGSKNLEFAHINTPPIFQFSPALYALLLEFDRYRESLAGQMAGM